ncbi:MAG: dihydrofolate reductase family protein [Myxococcaceae bacterium]|nr:dihydrofolate reductase family protein [Myxococcaceae bacterium]
MRKLIAIAQVSLDGVMQGPGGPDEDRSNGFSHGGWAMPFVDDDLKRIIDRVMGREFDLLLGRRTYEIWESYWPKQHDTVGKAFARATKFVVTNTLDELGWGPSKRISGDVGAELRRLKESNGPELHCWGSSQLLQALNVSGLVDEYQLWTFPVVLGKGKRLFESSAAPRGFTLAESHVTTGGVVTATYRPGADLRKEVPV